MSFFNSGGLYVSKGSGEKKPVVENSALGCCPLVASVGITTETGCALFYENDFQASLSMCVCDCVRVSVSVSVSVCACACACDCV